MAVYDVCWKVLVMKEVVLFINLSIIHYKPNPPIYPQSIHLPSHPPNNQSTIQTLTHPFTITQPSIRQYPPTHPPLLIHHPDMSRHRTLSSLERRASRSQTGKSSSHPEVAGLCMCACLCLFVNIYVSIFLNYYILFVMYYIYVYMFLFFYIFTFRINTSIVGRNS